MKNFTDKREDWNLGDGKMKYKSRDELEKELEVLKDRSCENCKTNPSNCRIFYGANRQLALSIRIFYCSLWESKNDKKTIA